MPKLYRPYKCYCYGFKQFGHDLDTVIRIMVTYSFRTAANRAVKFFDNLDPGTYNIVVEKDGEERTFKVTKHKPKISVLAC